MEVALPVTDFWLRIAEVLYERLSSNGEPKSSGELTAYNQRLAINNR